MSATNTAFTVFSAIGFVLSLIPLRWHLESWNVGTCMYMIWTALICLVYFVNSIVWSGNVINWAPVWCDICIRIQIGVAVAWPCCSLCIVRRLYDIASSTTVSASPAEKRRTMVIDLFITIGIPMLQMALEYIVAGHRFNIVEDFGCTPATYNTPLAYVLVWSWPLIIGVISACYGALTIRAFTKWRRQFKDNISTNSSLTSSRYLRLIILASADFCFTIPLAIRAIVSNALLGTQPWISWADTHWNYSHVIQVPRSVLALQPSYPAVFELTRWAAVLCAFVFFGFFGFAEEARKNYRLLASTVTKGLGYTTFTESTAILDSKLESGTRGSIPASIIKGTLSKTDSFKDSRLSAVTVVGDYELKVLPHSYKEQKPLPPIPEPVLNSSPPY